MSEEDMYRVSPFIAGSRTHSPRIYCGCAPSVTRATRAGDSLSLTFPFPASPLSLFLSRPSRIRPTDCAQTTGWGPSLESESEANHRSAQRAEAAS